MPRFAGENGARNKVLGERLANQAAKRGASASELAIAWVRAKGAAQGVTIVPTMGMRTRKHLAEALRALEVELGPADLAEIEAAVPASEVAGTRYPAAMMGGLDSER
jgi:aryl-alcohol dehydrogenase-like predicted oxidoreductase